MKTATTAFAKHAKWVGLAAIILAPMLQACAQPATAPASATPAAEQKASSVPASLSPGVAEVIRLAQSGVGEDVIKAYIDNSASAFDLSADHILYLKDLGISSELITAMLNRDSALRNQPAPASPPATEAPVVEQPAVPEPTVPVEAPLTPPTVEVSSPPAQVNYFYSDLAPYGTWVDLAGFGWCWQPTVVVINRGWSPYCHGGRWLYTDCGWYWQSDYSWGWAPFHYGRWYSHPRCGWVWAPGAVWAPAWVVWRQHGSYCGWAPLPPHASFQAGVGWSYNGVRVSASFDFGLRANQFTFVGAHDFNERDLHHRRLAPTQVSRFYNNTTIINNYTVNNNTIVNRGIPVERVTAAVRTPIQRATVRELPAGASLAAASAPRAERNQAVVYRPHLTAPAKTSPVTIQKVDERHPVIRPNPTVPVVSQPKPRGGGAWGVPATGSRRETPAAPRTSSQPGVRQPNVRQPGAPAPNQPVPGKAEPAPRAPSAPRAPQPAPRPAQPAALDHPSSTERASAPARARSPLENKELGRAASSSRAETAAPWSPAQTRGRSGQTQPGNRSGNPHNHSPQGHEQFALPSAPVHSGPHYSSPAPERGGSGKSQERKGAS